MEKIFSDAFATIRNYREDKLAGRLNAIPPPFPRLARAFPGWERRMYTIFTANSGVGKTKISKFFIITEILKFVMSNPQLEVSIRWYALEETKEEFALSFVSTILALQDGIRLSTAQLQSLGEFTMTEDLMKKAEKAIEFLKTFLAPVAVVDDIYNPYGIWKDVRAFAAKRGQFYFTGQTKDEAGKYHHVEDVPVKEGEMFSHYVPNNPREFVFIVTDHISLLSPEKHHENGLHGCMREYSQKYCLGYMKKKLSYHVINTQQQAAEKEKQEFTFKGKTIEEKLEPSLDGLANNKETQRDADMVIGFFSPTRYGINSYHGYDISRLKDQFRTIIWLKDSKNGIANKRIHCFIDGATNVLAELPLSSEMNDLEYKKFGG
jgi:hypothetical protein